jgi:hypothetical protein
VTRLRSRHLTAVLAAATVLGGAAPARADFAITGASVTPASLGAGTHPDVTVQTSFTPQNAPGSPQQVRNLVVHLPPGLVGNPRATARCSEAAFLADACPAGSRVGTVSVDAVALGLPITAPGDVYNLEAPATEPARLGTVVRPLGGLLGKLFVPVHVRLRPSDGGLDTEITDLPTTLNGIPTWLEQLTLTLDGTPAGASAPFMTLPTSCLPAAASIEAVPYGSPATPATHAAAPFTPTGCASVLFAPSATAQIDSHRRAEPSGYTVALELPATETPRRQAHVRRAEVVLPEGTTLSPGVASGGLEACAAPPCPQASKVGRVEFETPLLGALAGSVYLAAPTPARPLGLIVTVDDPRAPIVLEGAVHADPANGRLTTVFDDLPQVPFTRFALVFAGGPHAVLANPARCGSHTVTARLTPWSGGADATPSAAFTVDADVSGGACPASAPFRPGIGVSAASTRAGAPAGALTLTIIRPDGDQDLGPLVTDLPPGLSGSIAGVPLCPEGAAATGACPADSRVGGVRALVGPGDAPASLSGTVFLTGPAEGGLVGLAIVIPGKVGPIDLGTVVARAGIVLRGDGGLSVRTGALPRFVGGVPVSIRELSLTLDRPGFAGNPTSCSPLAVSASFTSADGATATAQAPYQATGCELLAFAPRISGSVGARGETEARDHPPVTTVITTPPGHAVARSAAVTLPAGIGVDITRLRSICEGDALATGNCPAASRLGTAEARTPLLPVPLTGDVVLARTQPAGLPGLTVLLRSPVALRLDGTFDLGTRRATFDGIPDVPLSRFELRFRDNGLLTLAGDLCAGAAPTIAAQFTGHNGKTASDRRAVERPGCAPKPRATLSLDRLGAAHPRLRLRVRPGAGGPALRRFHMTLPDSLQAGAPIARAGRRRVGAARRGGVVTVRLAGRGARDVTLTLPVAPERSLARRLGRRPRLSFALEVLDRDGDRAPLTLRVRARP